MDRRIEELESKEDDMEFRDEMRKTIHAVMEDTAKEILSLRTLVISRDEELEACKARIE